jgi:hypothetical protein
VPRIFKGIITEEEMKIFLRQKDLDRYVTDEVVADRLNQLDVIARRAAADALHYYTCVRTIEDWRKILAEAEKSENKYMSMAELVVAAGFKR